MKTEPCPICAEWRYKSLVAICPICGEKGGLEEVDDLASDFLRLWQTGTFEQIVGRDSTGCLRHTDASGVRISLKPLSLRCALSVERTLSTIWLVAGVSSTPKRSVVAVNALGCRSVSCQYPRLIRIVRFVEPCGVIGSILRCDGFGAQFSDAIFQAPQRSKAGAAVLLRPGPSGLWVRPSGPPRSAGKAWFPRCSACR